MGHHSKKRGGNSGQRTRALPPASSSPHTAAPAAALPTASTDGDSSTILFLVDDDNQAGTAPYLPPLNGSSTSGVRLPTASEAVKQECEKALMALRRGNHTKAIRLMKEASARHGSSALLHRVHGTVFVKVASLMDDPNAKLRYLRNAVESARRAVELSPCSVEFAHFYANLMFESAVDGKGYEEVVQECERALSIPEPVDPAMESLHQEDSQQRLGSTPEARVGHVHQELRSLIQKANIASISSWVKNLNGTSVGVGEEKFRLIPIRRLSSPEDPMEVKLIQSARRPNEIKKAIKTAEERRKEIEVRVAAARLLQQNRTPSVSHEDEPSPPSSSPSPSSSSSAQRLVERRKLMNARKLTPSADRMEQVKRYWNSLVSEERRSFLEIRVSDLKLHFSASKDTAASNFLLEALSHAEANGMWKFWLCCRCGEKFANSESHARHASREHLESLPPTLQCLFPQELDGDWVEMLASSSWKPIDTSAALRMLENKQLLKYQSLGQDNDSDENDKDRDSLSDYWSSRDTSDSSSSSPQGEPSVDNSYSRLPGERKDNCITNSVTGENTINFHKWPLSDDAERLKLLERIHSMFELLMKHRCLGTTHLNKIVQYTMHELQDLPSGSYFLNQGLEQSLLCISFLDASQLCKILKFLQDLLHSCGLGRYSEKDNLAEGMISVTEDSDFQEEISLNCDSSKLVLDWHLFRNKSLSNRLGNSRRNDGTESTDLLDANSIIPWLFSGPSTGEQLTAWNHLREEKFQQGTELFQALEKEFQLLQNACEAKGEHLNYEEALQIIENFQVDAQRREQPTKLDSQNYETFLRRRREELLKKENDVLSTNSRFELDAISNVLKDAQSLNLGHFGLDDMTSGLTSRIWDVDTGEWKAQDYLYQADSCIELAVQRQKELLSLEVGKIDARILRHVNTMQLLENKLGPTLSFDYRMVVMPFVKSFMRSRLEDLADKDASEKSEAAREAFLAELALDAKKNISKAGDHLKQTHEKKDKRKGKENRKTKDMKAFTSDGQDLYFAQVEEPVELPVATDTSKIHPELTNDYLDEEVENKRRIELEAEEKKLGEALEFQRRIEHEAKQRKLAEQCRKATTTSSGTGSNINLESGSYENGSENHNDRQFDNGFLTHLRGDKEIVNEIVEGTSSYVSGQKTKPPARGHPHSKHKQGSNETKTLRQLHDEEDDEERFQADIKRAMCQSLGMGPMEKSSESVFLDVSNSGDSTIEKNADVNDLLGAGLKNEVGEYNCFLNVIIQSLWHLRRFRDEFLRSSSIHTHVGEPCVVCALNDILTALSLASKEVYRDPVAPTSLRTALSNLHPNSSFFQNAQMNDASEVLEVIFSCLHQAFISSTKDVDAQLKGDEMSAWDCANNSCIVHQLFGMNVSEQMNCSNCGLESRHLKYTSFFHNINASALRTTKIACSDSPLDELLKFVEMNHQLVCDKEDGGCGKPNYIHHFLSTSPFYFTIVLGWQKACENANDISATLEALTINLDIGILYRGLDTGKRHSLVSVVCYYGQHYVCFSYNHVHEEWVMYDDNSVKVVGGWHDVLLLCKKGYLQPQVLFFQAAE